MPSSNTSTDSATSANPTNSKIICVTGGSGLVGSHVLSEALRHGHKVRVLTRQRSTELASNVKRYVWDPSQDNNEECVRALDGANMLINLAGSSIGAGRMTESTKQELIDSRLQAIDTLIKAFVKCDAPPPVWLQASAIGYYGNRGEQVLNESSAAQDGWFLAELCKVWEQKAREVSTLANAPRLIIARIGLVLAKDAPAWQKMLMPIKLGFGGRLGSGKQWFSWIDADDLAAALLFLGNDAGASGVYNLTTPHPVRQLELAKRAASILGRPAILPAPASILRAVLGETADALLLASCKALPERLQRTAFTFQYPDIDAELEHLLKNPGDTT